MRNILLFSWLMCSAFGLYGQFNPSFYPDFTAFPSNPIIKYGDGFADAAWNDPCVIKEGNQYIMYTTAAVGIILSDSNEVKVYRQVSTDGYNWTLSPTIPVLEPLDATYYGGGTETPSIIVKDGIYHMYLTCYPSGNDPSAYNIGHATSTDGIAWTMDAEPVLESDSGNHFYSQIVGEPGAVIYHDSIFVFFTSAGIVNGNAVQGIACMKSVDGSNFSAPILAFSLPTDVYPAAADYWGLSTPSALAINDSLYVFTDVAQTINGEWTQVALHQFKTDGSSDVWHHDSQAIHHMQDFTWTAGEYLSGLLAPCALLEADGTLRIWYAGHNIANVVGNDTIYNVTVDTEGMIHVLPEFYGIGTSSYQFQDIIGLNNVSNEELQFLPNPSNGSFQLHFQKELLIEQWSVFDALSQKVAFHFSSGQLNIEQAKAGIYFVHVSVNGIQKTYKLVVE